MYLKAGFRSLHKYIALQWMVTRRLKTCIAFDVYDSLWTLWSHVIGETTQWKFRGINGSVKFFVPKRVNLHHGSMYYAGKAGQVLLNILSHSILLIIAIPSLQLGMFVHFLCHLPWSHQLNVSWISSVAACYGVAFCRTLYFLIFHGVDTWCVTVGPL